MSTPTQKKAGKPKTTSPPTVKEQVIFTGNDKVIRDLVYAPSKEIDAIAAYLIIRDTGHIVEYLKQKLNLEKKYLQELASINSNLYECCTSHSINGVQKSFMDYVGLTDTLKPYREEYLEKLKVQLNEMIKFRSEQQKAYEKNKAWMSQSNQEYVIARLKKLPDVKEIYTQKWDEIDRSSAGATVSSPMLLTPMTPTLSTGTTLSGGGSAFPLLSKKLSHDEELDIRAMSMDDDRVRQQPLKFSDVAGGPQQSSRIERFMKRHLNKAEDPTRQNIRVAKLKVEIGEADTNYRNVVREISTLSIKIDATNHHILNNVQLALKEKAEKIKKLLELALNADLEYIQQSQQPIASLLDSVQQYDTDMESKKFNHSSSRAFTKYPKPPPIYYENHHVGVCKDLIFGTSLTEYAQQRGRSPPLLITKCIDAIERLGGLDREGIYRVSGKQSNMEKIRHAFEQDEEAVVIGENEMPEDIFSIASVIKIFLRELKSPLFPFKLTDRLVYSQIPDQELRLMNLLTRLIKLEPANYDTLKVLVHHLSKLQSRVEKNKMTTSNLTLIFTPAIFQDLNHAQHSPGEWAKDCVLEDLIMNSQDIFANKDLHNNSAITGHIQYGFDHTDAPVQSMHANRYAMTIQSPDSPTGKSQDHNDDDVYSFVGDDDDEEEEDDNDYTISLHDANSSSTSIVSHLSADNLPKRSSSRSNSPSPPLSDTIPVTPNKTSILPEQAPLRSENTPLVSAQAPVSLEQVSPAPAKNTEDTPSRSGSVERRKYQAHFQGKGLKVDTGSSPSLEVRDGAEHHIPIIKSATVPSYDWLKFDPENANNPPAVPKLRRSATTGKKISRRKMSIHNPDEGGVPPLPPLHRGGSSSTTTTTIP
ncbi:hypothetical protein INT47_000868 [Mucor saturninus]|uniref:Rho-GAP domain-containing protein n=1 Tax=Mucor saturninus TaxID=64648 RepID=A0A8H7VD11_9FUNG|nr:hypothetical protein INT47_000868 [Mucor saturninus]